MQFIPGELYLRIYVPLVPDISGPSRAGMRFFVPDRNPEYLRFKKEYLSQGEMFLAITPTKVLSLKTNRMEESDMAYQKIWFLMEPEMKEGVYGF